LPSKVISGSTNVVDFGTNRKRVFDFLLVINSDVCHILHRFGDTAAKRRKSPIRTYPTLIQGPRSGCMNPLNFGMNLISAKTRIMGKKSWSYVKPRGHSPRVWQTDGQIYD